MPEGGVLRGGKPVGSIVLQGCELPYPRREVAGCVPGYILRVLGSHLRTEHPIPDRCHTVTRALSGCNPRRVKKGTTPDQEVTRDVEQVEGRARGVGALLGRRRFPLLPLQPPARTDARLAGVGVSRTSEREHEWQRHCRGAEDYRGQRPSDCARKRLPLVVEDQDRRRGRLRENRRPGFSRTFEGHDSLSIWTG